ncbi:alpha/beta hydrolase family protein [Thalassotalea maritima]|uniref:alpha/beta hydrolase family protein n=1 Tax=Thalassotalea maritima TaxID=3242416 RepID=UPI0035276636
MRALLLSLGMLLLFTTSHVKAYSLTYADYAKLPEKSKMAISPSGTKIAYRLTGDDKDYLIVVDLEKGDMIRAVDVASVNPDFAYFVDENKIILLVSKSSRLLGMFGRYDVSVAFSFNLETGGLHQLLTAGKGIYAPQTALGRVVGVSPDKKYAYMPAWDEREKYSLFKVDISKRRSPKIHKKGTPDTIDFFVDANGELLARERFNNNLNRHRLEAWHDGEWKIIFEEKTDIRHVNFAGITADYQHIVMIRQDEEHGRWAYYTLSLTDGTEAGPLFSREDRDIEHVLSDVNRVVYGVQYSGFKPSYEFFDKKLNARLKGIQKALPNSAITIADYTSDWSNIVLHIDGEGSSGQFVKYSQGGLSSLGLVRPHITDDNVHNIQETSYTARDGLVIPTLLTLPNNKLAEKLPTIMLPHGGPEAYDKIQFDWLAQYFASQGYLVIQPQFRGSTGFGTKHLFAGRGEWGRKMQDDLTDAVQEFAKQGLVDADKVCIVGASYGGYAALAGATFTPDVYQCAVSINGVANVEHMMRVEKQQYGRNHWVVSYWDKVISNGTLDDDHLHNISPVNFVDKVKIPVLLIHGEHDLVVPIRQSEEMYDELGDAGKKVTFIELENENHDIEKPHNRAITLEAIDKFVKQYL